MASRKCNMSKFFLAAKGIINYEGKILLVRESAKYDVGTQTGKWDVPGGRLDPDESFDQALLREIREETGLSVKIGRPVLVNQVNPVVKGEEWQVVRMFFECLTDQADVTLGEDHDAYEWIDPEKYADYPIIENLRPVFEAYLGRWQPGDPLI